MRRVELPSQTLTPHGGGATARVYRVHHPEWGDVAVKLLRRSDAVSASRLQREAEAQSRLQHPNICPVLGVADVDGQPGIVMRFVDGLPLDRALLALSLEASMAVLADVCDAIAHAHAAGLVHRDLKPANILVEWRDGRAVPSVLDFGLVRDGDSSTLTQAGDMLGTPAYMAPEQARGAAHAADHRVDIFSLGCIAFRLATGRDAFEGDSVPQVLERILHGEAPLAHRLDVRVPIALSRICAQCMEREPARRYVSAAALRDDLLRWVRGESPKARSTGPAYRARRWLLRNRVAGAAAGLALVVALAALVTVMRAREQGAQHAQLLASVAATSESVRSRMRLVRLAPVQSQQATVEQLGAELVALGLRTEGLDGVSAHLARRAMGEAWLALDAPDTAMEWLRDAVERQTDVAALQLFADAAVARFEARTAALPERTPEQIDSLGDDVRQLLDGAETALARATVLAGEVPVRAATRLALLQGRLDDAVTQAARYHGDGIADYAGESLLAEALVARARDSAERGDLDRARVDLDAARAQFDQALRIGRSDARLLQAACRAEADRIALDAKRGDAPPTAPAAACDAALVVRPDRSAGWSARALVHGAIATAHGVRDAAAAERSALDAMLADANEAFRLTPDQPESAMLLASAQMRIAQLKLGDFDANLAGYQGALDVLERVRAVHPTHTLLLRELATLYRGRGRLKVNYQRAPDDDFARAIGLYRQALAQRPDSVALADDLSLAYVFAFYSERVRDPAAARALAEQAIAVLDTVLARHPDHPEALATQAANRADLWAFLRALAPGDAPPEIAPLRERAQSDFSRLRTVAPARPDGYAGAAMLELTASDFAHDRERSEPDALDRAEALFAQARSADVVLPHALEGWLATERARAALAADASPQAALTAARAFLRADVEASADARLLARRTELELLLAEVRWRLRRGLAPDPALARGLSMFEDLSAEQRDVGDSVCDGGELLLVRAQTRGGARRQAAAAAAAAAFDACIASSPFAYAYQQPRLLASRALLAGDTTAASE